MQITYKQTILILLFGAIFAAGCFPNASKNSPDTFYTASKIGDLYRIPLYKPVEVVSPDKSTWFLRVGNNESPLHDLSMDQIAVIDSMIITYTSSIYIDYEMSQAWYVIDSRDLSHTYFTQPEKFNEYIEATGLEKPLVSVSKLYEDYWGGS